MLTFVFTIALILLSSFVLIEEYDKQSIAHYWYLVYETDIPAGYSDLLYITFLKT